MLTQLMRLLEQNQGQIDLTTLSLQLQAEPSAVAGMLETLLQKGRLVEANLACGGCHDCPIGTQCPLPTRRARQFIIASDK